MRANSLGELAWLYLPWCSSRREAEIKLRRWMKANQKLRCRLAELDYLPGQVLLTPLQYQAFIEFFGAP